MSRTGGHRMSNSCCENRRFSIVSLKTIRHICNIYFRHKLVSKPHTKNKRGALEILLPNICCQFGSNTLIKILQRNKRILESGTRNSPSSKERHTISPFGWTVAFPRQGLVCRSLYLPQCQVFNRCQIGIPVFLLFWENGITALPPTVWPFSHLETGWVCKAGYPRSSGPSWVTLWLAGRWSWSSGHRSGSSLHRRRGWARWPLGWALLPSSFSVCIKGKASQYHPKEALLW